MRLFTFTFSLVFAALVAPVASQEYQEMRWKGTNKCLTSPPNPKNLDRVYLSQCTGATNQRWNNPGFGESGVLSVQGPLASGGGHYCLALDKMANGSPAIIRVCSKYAMYAGWWSPNNNNKLLELARSSIVSSGPGHFGFCIDVTNGNPADGNPLQGWQCYADNPNQQWAWGGITGDNPKVGSC